MQYALIGLMAVLTGAALGSGCSQWTQPAADMQQKQFAALANPASNASQILRSVHYLKLMGRQDLAMKELQDAVVREPENLKLLNALGSCYDELGEYAKAREYYHQVLSRDPDNQAALNNLGYSHYLAGEGAAAEDFYKQAIAKNPKNVFAANNLGLLLVQQGREKQARQLWREVEGEARAQKKLEQVLAKLAAAPAPGPVPKPPAASEAKSPEAKREMQIAQAVSPEAQPKAAAAQEAPGKPGAKVVTARPATVREVAPPEANEVHGKGAVEPAKGKEATQQAASPPVPVTAPPVAPAAEKAATKPEPVVQATLGVGEKSAAAKTAAAPVEATPPEVAESKDKMASGPPPTAAELEKVAIEVRNGNGAAEIANLARDLLKGNGLKVRLIGNHIDFGVPETIVYYRQASKGVAAEINRRFFGATKLVQSNDLRPDVDVKVLMGHDILKGNPIFAHLKTTYPVHAKTAVAAVTPGPAAAGAGAASTGPLAMAGPPVQAAAPLANSVGGLEVQPASNPPEVKAGAKMLEPAGLAVEVRNGTRAADLARVTREVLQGHGYKVPVMGNHVDFGAATTVIYYRPTRHNAALELNNRYFKAKKMVATSKLRAGVDVKVLLGSDIFQNSAVFTACKP